MKFFFFSSTMLFTQPRAWLALAPVLVHMSTIAAQFVVHSSKGSTLSSGVRDLAVGYTVDSCLAFLRFD